MKIVVYGPGCTNCKKTYDAAKEAVGELGLDAEVVKVEDIQKMMEAGVMGTPALEIDGKLVSSGKRLSVERIKKLISEE